MKKIILICIYVLSIMLCFASCGESNDTNNNNQTENEVTDNTESDSTHIHNYSAWQTTKKATCTQNGEQTRDCTCGDIQTRPIYTAGHSYSWVIIKAATCIEKGEEAGTCKCGAITTRDIAPTGHNWQNATCKTAKTCSTCALTEGDALGHNYDGIKCTRCNDIVSVPVIIECPSSLVYYKSEFKLENFEYKFTDYKNYKKGLYLNISFDAIKTYDNNGDFSTDSCWFNYVLYDADGTIVDSSYGRFEGVVNQKCHKEIYISLTELSSSYKLVFANH